MTQKLNQTSINERLWAGPENHTTPKTTIGRNNYASIEALIARTESRPNPEVS